MSLEIPSLDVPSLDVPSFDVPSFEDTCYEQVSTLRTQFYDANSDAIDVCVAYANRPTSSGFSLLARRRGPQKPTTAQEAVNAQYEKIKALQRDLAKQDLAKAGDDFAKLSARFQDVAAKIAALSKDLAADQRMAASSNLIDRTLSKIQNRVVGFQNAFNAASGEAIDVVTQFGAFFIGDASATPAPPADVAPPDPKTLDLSRFAHATKELYFPLAEGETLKLGSAEALSETMRLAIRRVQEWLKFHDESTAVDDDFGAATEAAVKAFQARSKLPQTGEVDVRTWAALVAPMHQALAPVATGSDLRAAVLQVAHAHLAKSPMEFSGNNDGPWVRLYMKWEGAQAYWCAGFACFIVEQAARDIGVPAPFARSASCDVLVRNAKAEDRFIEGSALGAQAEVEAQVKPGDLYVHQPKEHVADWDHIGIIVDISRRSFTAIEGNTSTASSRNGYYVEKKHRSFAKRDYIRLI